MPCPLKSSLWRRATPSCWRSLPNRAFYEQSPNEVATTLNAVTESEQALDRALERLVELEG